MTSIFARVYNALVTLGWPLALDAYLTANNADLPDAYLVYSLITSTAAQSADDVETLRTYLVQVTYWNRSGLSSPPNTDEAMTLAGFRKSDQRQLPRDPDTGHYGLATDYTYLEETT